MKLHLPKLLCAALLCANVSPAFAEDYNVGIHTGSNKLPSDSGNYKTYNGDVTLTDSDRMGVFAEDGRLLGDKDFGKEEWKTKSTVGKELVQVSSGTVVKNVNVTGTLSLNGSSQVSLGGQYKTPTTYLGLGNFGTYGSSIDEFTGLIVNNLEVNDNAQLNTWNAIANKVTVNGGTVNIHTYRAEGNMGYRLEDARDSKQVQFKEELNINGGTVTVGHGSYIDYTNSSAASTQNPETDYHTITAFGSFSYEGNPTIVGSTVTGVSSYEINSSQINQTDGTLIVRGKSLSIGGLNINQSGGNLEISKDTYHFLADYGDSTIEQSGGTMTLGCLKAFNTYYDSVVQSLEENGQKAEINPSVAIIQTGEGVMNLNGVKFTNQKTGAASTEKSTIAQSGKGTINLNGVYEGATFDITQSGQGGTINVNGSLSAQNVNQSNGGTINVSDSAILEATEVNAGQVKIEGAALSGGSISTVENKVTIAGDLAAADVTVNGGELRNEGHMVVSGHIVLKEGSSLVNKGTISASSAYALMMTDEQAAEMLNVGVTDLIVVEAGATLDNLEGNIEASVLVQGGTVTLATGSTQDITMESGEIFVTGQVETGSLTLKGGTINFSEGASVELRDGDMLDLNGATIVINVEDVSNMVDSTIVNLFNTTDESAISNLAGTKVQFVDQNNATVSGTITGTVENGGGSMTVLLPEPTTATLSLLALAGLAMRRRRK